MAAVNWPATVIFHTVCTILALLIYFATGSVQTNTILIIAIATGAAIMVISYLCILCQADSARKEMSENKLVPIYECVVFIRFVCNLLVSYGFFMHLLALKRRFKNSDNVFNLGYLITPLDEVENSRELKSSVDDWKTIDHKHSSDGNTLLLILLILFPIITLLLEGITLKLFMSSCPRRNNKSRRYRPLAMGQNLMPISTRNERGRPIPVPPHRDPRRYPNPFAGIHSHTKDPRFMAHPK
ncbi:hypothetical protein DdX_08238 [Ditylenchus destructor]|uniref:Uncharacterized protein n=1 Tax=Ditylenchus destructor TaxID=166010 RepID=A0AAD4N846_9BILA|nr:hypothetical protein DdX_08238 [Ditylenchus destructor]